MSDYTSLKQSLNLSVAVDWLYEDSKDDFFPDYFMFRDILETREDYLEQRKYRIYQVDAIPSLMEYVPKANGMLREAIWLHPTHRILYLAILHFLLPKLDKVILPTIYSYRLDRLDDPDAYPFPNRAERWKNFQNDFRRAALDKSTNTILLTDLSSFYDHISIECLVQRILSMLGSSVDANTEIVVEFLKQLLNLWSTTSYGIPQNFDPSSFFGSLYLHNADTEMLNNRRYQYFRWVDDIRICAKNRDQALRSLHDLQRVLAKDRLFLASDKTKIIEKGTAAFEKLMDVEDDVIISETEEAITRGDMDSLKKASDITIQRLQIHSAFNGDDRKFRAYANRLLSIADFEELAELVHPEIRKFVLPRLRSHPERSDYWTKMLAQVIDGTVLDEAKNLLTEHPSIFDWQRFYLWRMLTVSNNLLPELLESAKTTARLGISVLERAQAILCIGKHGTNTEKESIFTELFSAQMPYPIQRALIAAIQELPEELRNRFFDRAININSDHKQFIDFITAFAQPSYGERPRAIRHCREEPRKMEVFQTSGVGLVKGARTTFRLSRSHYDYE